MTVVRSTEEQLELADIQGDVLLGLQKDAELFVGFAILDVARFKRFLKGLHVTTGVDVKRADAAIRAAKANGSQDRLDIRGVNIGFTFDGLGKLGAPGIAGIGDAAFKDGLAKRSPTLNDPPDGPGKLSDWLVGNGAGPLDGIVLLTGRDLRTVRAMFGELVNAAGADTWLPFFTGEGRTRPGAERGHEAFGFLDGVSQPAVRGRIDQSVPGEMFLDPGQNPKDPNQGLPGADLHWPGEFVFGYQSQDPTDIEKPGPPSDGGAPWMRNGSFMVYRRLEQLVPEFDAKVAAEATAHALTAAEMGARIVGRFKSGWPVIVSGHDDPVKGPQPLLNNDFEFGGDPKGVACPFAAHIRKSYPRDDTTPGGGEPDTQTRRIMRAGIPFGPEVGADERKAGRTSRSRGLMFVCYQTSIVDQFEFMMKFWINNPDFHDPGTGQDPLIGQAPGANRTRIDTGLPKTPPKAPITFAADFVRPTGGGYFFMPSIKAIDTILSA